MDVPCCSGSTIARKNISFKDKNIVYIFEALSMDCRTKLKKLFGLDVFQILIELNSKF